jgi:hypothetical protein
MGDDISSLPVLCTGELKMTKFSIHKKYEKNLQSAHNRRCTSSISNPESAYSPVCVLYWDEDDTKVVCKELGYRSEVTVNKYDCAKFE